MHLDTAGYHLAVMYFIYSHHAPFAYLHCDQGRLWRTAKEHISTHLEWHCKIPPDGGPYYYQTEHFEAVWRDVSYVLTQYILPQMEAMTKEGFILRLLERSRNDEDFFLPDQPVSLTIPGFPGTNEAAVYGVELWRLERYEEAVPYLTLARERYRDWLTDFGRETEHISLCIRKRLALLDELLSCWERREECYMLQAQKQINQIPLNWVEYML
ncbi:MAG: hypothetical protein NC126_11135 [Clostridium sp.]|nr:hypothetical protein [Clostridium sp.]